MEEIKKKFEGGDDESRKVAELKQVEQGNRIIKKFVQEFRRVARESGYKRRPLVEEFKRGINKSFQQRLMESECQPKKIEKWYKRAIRLDGNIRKSIREEKEKRRKIKERKIREVRRIEKEWRKVELGKRNE